MAICGVEQIDNGHTTRASSLADADTRLKESDSSPEFVLLASHDT